MTYLGQGSRRSGFGLAQDELKVLQQVNGGENICVFKGPVSPGGRYRPRSMASVALSQKASDRSPMVQSYIDLHLLCEIDFYVLIEEPV